MKKTQGKSTFLGSFLYVRTCWFLFVSNTLVTGSGFLFLHGQQFFNDQFLTPQRTHPDTIFPILQCPDWYSQILKHLLLCQSYIFPCFFDCHDQKFLPLAMLATLIAISIMNTVLFTSSQNSLLETWSNLCLSLFLM